MGVRGWDDGVLALQLLLLLSAALALPLFRCSCCLDTSVFCCQLRRERLNAKLAAKSFQRDVAAFEDGNGRASRPLSESLLQHGQPVVLASLP